MNPEVFDALTGVLREMLATQRLQAWTLAALAISGLLNASGIVWLMTNR